LGVVQSRDGSVLWSNNAGPPELPGLPPAFRSRGVSIVTITCHPDSSLGRGSDCVLDLGRLREACPEDLLPTTTTTAALALGDALAIVLLRMKGLTREGLAVLHPCGVLGKIAMLRAS